MIIIDSIRKKKETLLKKYPNAILANVTSKAKDDLVKLSPFYPHGGIPIPFSKGYEGVCVEGIWQGLKVFEKEGIDKSKFYNSSMQNIKRSVRRLGNILGHQKGVDSEKLLDYLEARKDIYAPAYRWVLENKVSQIIERLREANAQGKTIVLLDYTTNCDIEDPSKPLSHAALVKAYVEGTYPYIKENKQPGIFDLKE